KFGRALLVCIFLRGGLATYSPKKLVGYHYGRATCVILDDDSVKCWGRLFNGMQATGIEAFIGNAANQMGDNLPSADFGVGRTAVDIGVSAYAILDCSCVLSDIGVTDSKIGDDAFELGDFLPAISLGSGRTAKQIAVGDRYACALLDNNLVKLGTSRSIFKDYSWFVYSKFAAVAPAETRPQKDFLRFLREVVVNRIEGDTRLGYGDETDRSSTEAQMGDALPFVDLGTGRTAQKIGCGDSHVCALLDDNTLKCWGGNYNGQCGQDTTNDIGKSANQMGDYLPAIDVGAGRTVTDFVAGYKHTCAILDDGNLKCWGYANYGHLGHGDRHDRGGNDRKMATIPTVDLGTGLTVKKVFAGWDMTCAILSDDRTKCWGSAGNGKLGHGDDTPSDEWSVGDESGEMGDSLPATNYGTGRTAQHITMGNGFQCALLDDATVKCMGYGEWLGYGDTTDRGQDSSLLGDHLPVLDFGTLPTTSMLGTHVLESKN
ncbi:UVR8, partial [Symbiodinium sp. KB8]